MSNLLSPYEWYRWYQALDRRVQFGPKRQFQFLKALKELLESDVPLISALRHMSNYGDAPQKELTTRMLQQLRHGSNVAIAMKGWFPDRVISALETGEAAGTILESLDGLVTYMERQRKGLTPLLLGLLYPSLLFLGSFSLAAFIDNQVLKVFRSMSGYQSEFGHEYLVFVHALSGKFFLFAPVLIFGSVLFMQYLRTAGPIRLKIQHIPPVSLYTQIQAVHFLQDYAILALTKMPEKRIFELLLQGGSAFYRHHLQRMRNNLLKSDNIAECIDTGLIPSEAIAYLKTVAQAKGYHKALLESQEQIFEVVQRNIGITLKGISMLLFVFVATVAMACLTVVFYKPQFAL